MKPIWRRNFDIKRVDYQMPYPVLEEFFNFQKSLFKKAYLKRAIWVIENNDNVGTYFLVSELRKLIKTTLNLIISKPSLIDKLHSASIKNNLQYFKFSKLVEKKNLQKVGSAKLIKDYKHIIALQRLGHGQSTPTTWFLDSDGEDYSKWLFSLATNKIKLARVPLDPNIVFSTLTTPLKDSMGRIEEMATLKLVNKLRKDQDAWLILSREPLENLNKFFGQFSPNTQKLISAHFNEWRWVPYTYNGPAYNLDYYLQVLGGLARENVNVKLKLSEFSNQKKQVQRDQAKYFKALKLSKKEKQYFKIAQDIIFLKGFRKDCLYRGGYARDLILKELARRLNVTVMQLKYLAPFEVEKAVKKGEVDANISNARQKFSVIYMVNGKNTVYVGDTARKFLTKFNFEKETEADIQNLQGTCACPGTATGRIKIINLPEEMGKMEVGDIMIAHTTFPSLVPAMKKAAAIATEDGGITCHAAIVSRELKIPCVVGIKALTKVLKDGDKVVVDATNGVINKVE